VPYAHNYQHLRICAFIPLPEHAAMKPFDPFNTAYGAQLAEHDLFGARSVHGGSCSDKYWCLCERTAHLFLRAPTLHGYRIVDDAGRKEVCVVMRENQLVCC
jgi:hypothetical protein